MWLCRASCSGENPVGSFQFEVSSQHLFRYASEWDPRAPGHTKVQRQRLQLNTDIPLLCYIQGGYLQGNIQLPRDVGDLRLVFSTVADRPMAIDEELCRQYPGLETVHPTILFIIRKGKGNRYFWLEEINLYFDDSQTDD